MCKSLFLSLVFLLSVNFHLYADGDINSEDAKKLVHMGQTNAPQPHLIDIAEPIAMYTISTAMIDITFDATYYSEYTIHLVSDYFEIDYFVYTPVVYIPVATLGDIVDIYIESDDCGCYYGTLDKSAYTNTY